MRAILRRVRLVLQVIGFMTVCGTLAILVALPFVGIWLQPRDEAVRSDYIVVLAGDEHRYIKAAELYKAAFAPKILLSNEYEAPKSRIQKLISELGYPNIGPKVLRSQVLEYLGVPPAAFQEFGTGSISTAEEAESLKRFIGLGPFSAILVTSPFSARRTKLIFQTYMPTAHFVVVTPPERAIDGRWWRDQQSALLTGLEIMKIIYFYVGGAFHSG